MQAISDIQGTIPSGRRRASGTDSDGRERKKRNSDAKKRMFWAAKAAFRAGVITGAEWTVLDELIRYALDTPDGHYVYVRSQTTLAESCRKSTASVLRAIRSLEAKGMVIDCTGGGGRRGACTRTGVYFGIDVSPLLLRYDELLQRETEAQRAAKEHDTLARKLSSVRWQLRRRVEAVMEALSDAPAAALALLERLPRRYAHLDRAELRSLVEAVEAELDRLGQAEMSDRAGENAWPHTITMNQYESCNTAEDTGRNGTAAHEYGNHGESCTKGWDRKKAAPTTISLETVEKLVPPEHAEWLTIYGNHPKDRWSGLFEIARGMWAEEGGDARTFLQVREMLGLEVSATLTLLAAHQNRRGTVRNLSRYLFGCARLVRMRNFNWTDGISGAVKFNAAA